MFSIKIIQPFSHHRHVLVRYTTCLKDGNTCTYLLAWSNCSHATPYTNMKYQSTESFKQTRYSTQKERFHCAAEPNLYPSWRMGRCHHHLFVSLRLHISERKFSRRLGTVIIRSKNNAEKIAGFKTQIAYMCGEILSDAITSGKMPFQHKAI